MHTGTDANRSFHLTGTNGPTAQETAYVNNEWDWIDGKPESANTGTQAAVFHVYDRYKLDRLPRRFVVEPGKALSDSWNAFQDNLGLYDLWVLGPNGFHRHFKGDTNRVGDGHATPEIRVCYDIANDEVYVDLMNGGTQACQFTVTPKAYRKDGPWSAAVQPKGKQSMNWALQASGCWYDFEVTCDSDTAFYRRFAGRMETGKHSLSDPALG